MKTTIYGIQDPTNDQLRYVGKTSVGLGRRLDKHIAPCKLKKGSHCQNWLKGLVAQGIRPEIFEIETVDGNGNDAERFWISYFRYIGADLTNIAAGGEGAPGVKVSAETRAKLSKALTGSVHSAETRKKMSESLKGRVFSPESRQKLRVAAIRQHARNRGEIVI